MNPENQPIDDQNETDVNPVETGVEEQSLTEQEPVQEEPQNIPPEAPASGIEPVQWVAHEYVHPEKNTLWFVVFWVVVVSLIAFDVFLLKSWTFSVLVVVMAVSLVIYIRRPPRELQYSLSPAQGLYIGEKLYHLSEFKSFGVVRDGEHFSIMLIPIKRFAPAVSVYFPEDAGEAIVDILGSRLPMEEHKPDLIDQLVRKLRL